MKTNNTSEKIKKFLPIVLILFVLITPVFVLAYNPLTDPVIPQCSPNCGYSDLLQLASNLISWVIMISVPIATGVFAWAGIVYMTTGVADKKSYAKGMMISVLKGFVAILAAWLIVTTITGIFLNSSISIPLK